MNKFIQLFFLTGVIFSQGCNSHVSLDIEMILPEKIKSLKELTNFPKCSYVENNVIFKITNIYDETLLVEKGGENECFFWDRRIRYIYSPSKDSLLGVAIGIGDTFEPSKFDTLLPNESRYYLGDKEGLVSSASFGDSILFLQYYWPVSFLETKSEEKHLKILLRHNRNSGEISQMSFTVPDDLTDMKIPK